MTLVKTCMGIPSLEDGGRTACGVRSWRKAETTPLLVRETVVKVEQVDAGGGSFGRWRNPTLRQGIRGLDQRLVDLGRAGIQREDKAITPGTNRSACAPRSRQTGNSPAAMTIESVYMYVSGTTEGRKAR